jgi:predicted nucleic acid-binding protein
MPKKIIVDAGPIIGFFDRKDEHHDWAAEQFSRFKEFETCEAAVAEACARLAYAGFNQKAVIQLVREGVLKLTFDTGYNIGRIFALMDKYEDLPMDFADACLVVMTEEEKDSLLVTLDKKDFSVFRRHGRDLIPILSPNF